MEGCVHLESYKKYKKKIFKCLRQRAYCVVCKSDSQIHFCLDCNVNLCFDHLNLHFCRKQKVNESKNHVKTPEYSKTGGFESSNYFDEKSEIVQGFLTNNFSFISKTSPNTDFIEPVSTLNSTINDNFNEQGINQGLNLVSGNFSISGSQEKSSYSVTVSRDSTNESYSSDLTHKCEGLLFNTKHEVIYCFKCKNYLQFPNLREQLLQRKFFIKNQKNFSRIRYSFIKGLQNMGNSCYVNSILQIFINCDKIRYKFIDGSHEKLKCTEPYCIICVMKNLIIETFSTTACLVPNEFLYSFFVKMKNKYNSDQFDSYEFFLDLCNVLHEQVVINEKHTENHQNQEEIGKLETDKEENGTEKNLLGLEFATNEEKHKTEEKKEIVDETCKCLVHSTFKGEIGSIFVCESCKYENKKVEIFNSISVPTLKSVEESFLSFFKEKDVLEDVSCPNCQQQCTMTRVQHLKEIPPVLCVHLKRYENVTGSLIKNTKDIKIDQILSVEEISERNGNYKLFGVVCHTGMMKSGHYFCFLQKNNRWFKFDDENVKHARFSEIPGDMAYMLFYQLEE